LAEAIHADMRPIGYLAYQDIEDIALRPIKAIKPWPRP
jgi:hypothetical protein